MNRVLLVDDEEEFRRSVAEALRLAHYEVVECADAREAMAHMRDERIDALLTDLRMPGSSGIDLLREAVKRVPDAVLLVVTANGSAESAVEAIRGGANDYLVKPVRIEALLHKLDQFLRHRQTQEENRYLREAPTAEMPVTGLIGKSPALADLERLIRVVAPTDSTVLIYGETGTGKELVARAIHRASPRMDRPFVALNCGAIAESLLESHLFGHVRGAFTGADRDRRGFFETARDGTLFLDEIGELPLQLQPKVLRALEAREILPLGSTTPVPVTARIVAATHRDLRAMSESGRFRKDLYFRLSAFEIAIAPLRSRPEDVELIAKHLLTRIARSLGRPVPTLGSSALSTLEHYPWPGNVRELANVLERAMILSKGPSIEAEDLPSFISPMTIPPTTDLRTARKAFERLFVNRVINECAGDKEKAAKALGIGIASLYRKLQGWSSRIPSSEQGRTSGAGPSESGDSKRPS